MTRVVEHKRNPLTAVWEALPKWLESEGGVECTYKTLAELIAETRLLKSTVEAALWHLWEKDLVCIDKAFGSDPNHPPSLHFHSGRIFARVMDAPRALCDGWCGEPLSDDSPSFAKVAVEGNVYRFCSRECFALWIAESGYSSRAMEVMANALETADSKLVQAAHDKFLRRKREEAE